MIEAFPTRDLTGTPRKTGPGPGAPFDYLDLDAEPAQPPGGGPTRSIDGGFESFRIRNTAGFPRHLHVAFLKSKFEGGDLPALVREFRDVPANGTVDILDFFGTFKPPAGFTPGGLRVDWFGERLGGALVLSGLSLRSNWSNVLRNLLGQMPRNLAPTLRPESDLVRIAAPRDFEFLSFDMSATVSVSSPILGIIPRRIEMRIGYRVRSIHTNNAPPRLEATPFGGRTVRGFDVRGLLNDGRRAATDRLNAELRGTISGERARILYEPASQPGSVRVYGNSTLDRAIVVVHP